MKNEKIIPVIHTSKADLVPFIKALPRDLKANYEILPKYNQLKIYKPITTIYRHKGTPIIQLPLYNTVIGSIVWLMTSNKYNRK